MKTILNSMQAFKAMEYFLDYYYEIDHSPDLALLLDEMSICDDEMVTLDPASWYNWLKFTNKKVSMTDQAAFKSMIKYLEYFGFTTNSKDVATLLLDMQLSDDDVIINEKAKQLWQECIKKASQEDTQWRMP